MRRIRGIATIHSKDKPQSAALSKNTYLTDLSDFTQCVKHDKDK